MPKVVVTAIVAMISIAVFQNCGQGFSTHDVASAAPSVFPTGYQQYGGIPSQGVTALPPAYKVRAQSSATSGKTLTCTKPTGCYR